MLPLVLHMNFATSCLLFGHQEILLTKLKEFICFLIVMYRLYCMPLHTRLSIGLSWRSSLVCLDTMNCLGTPSFLASGGVPETLCLSFSN